MKNFAFNGGTASSYGLRIDSVDTYGAPERVVTEHQIPGPVPRIYAEDEGKASPYLRQYNCVICRGSNLQNQTAALKQWLMVDNKYHKLEDDYQPDVYRMARFTGSFSTDWLGAGRRSLTIPITFSCQPQLFLKSGDTETTIAQSGYTYIRNTTPNIAFPIIKMTFPSTAPVDGARGIRFTSTYGYIIANEDDWNTHIKGRTFTIDTQTEEIVDNSGTRANGFFTLSGNLYLLKNSNNGFIHTTNGSSQASSSVLDITIQPRWWRW